VKKFNLLLVSSLLLAANQPVSAASFQSAFNETIKNEGGYRTTVDRVFKNKKNKTYYKRVFNSKNNQLKVNYHDGKITLINSSNNKKTTINQWEIDNKKVIITNTGIDSRHHKGVDLLNITKSEIKHIYKKQYWSHTLSKSGGDVASVCFDISVNQGRGTRNRLFAKITKDLVNYEINTAIGISKADFSIIKGVEQKHPGAIVYALGKYSIERYEAIAERSPRFKKYLAGWKNRANTYIVKAGSKGKKEYEFLLENAEMGREAIRQQELVESTPLKTNEVKMDLTKIKSLKKEDTDSNYFEFVSSLFK